ALYGLEREFLGCNSREAVLHVETHLEAKKGPCTGACTVVPVDAVFHDVLESVEVGLFHRASILDP
ncbi:MAG: hypothetical protein QG636_433, partial [Patescibacteria group bacterium]|nr:hypothetical protein [Patescibacteria group bacterium]